MGEGGGGGENACAGSLNWLFEPKGVPAGLPSVWGFSFLFLLKHFTFKGSQVQVKGWDKLKTCNQNVFEPGLRALWSSPVPVRSWQRAGEP